MMTSHDSYVQGLMHLVALMGQLLAYAKVKMHSVPLPHGCPDDVLKKKKKQLHVCLLLLKHDFTYLAAMARRREMMTVCGFIVLVEGDEEGEETDDVPKVEAL